FFAGYFAFFLLFFQADDGIRDFHVTGGQTCALPISAPADRTLLSGGFQPQQHHRRHRSGTGHRQACDDATSGLAADQQLPRPGQYLYLRVSTGAPAGSILITPPQRSAATGFPAWRGPDRRNVWSPAPPRLPADPPAPTGRAGSH